MGNQHSSSDLEEMTQNLAKTPFYVYMNPLTLKDFARCFIVKKLPQGQSLSQPGDMYIVARGCITMTTLLEVEDTKTHAKQVVKEDHVRVREGDASSGRTFREKKAGGERGPDEYAPQPSSGRASSPSGGNNLGIMGGETGETDLGERLEDSVQAAVDKERSDRIKRAESTENSGLSSPRSVVIRQLAGELCSTGNLKSSGIMTELVAERSRKQARERRASLKGPDDGSSPLSEGGGVAGSYPGRRNSSSASALLQAATSLASTVGEKIVAATSNANLTPNKGSPQVQSSPRSVAGSGERSVKGEKSVKGDKTPTKGLSIEDYGKQLQQLQPADSTRGTMSPPQERQRPTRGGAVPSSIPSSSSSSSTMVPGLIIARRPSWVGNDSGRDGDDDDSGGEKVVRARSIVGSIAEAANNAAMKLSPKSSPKPRPSAVVNAAADRRSGASTRPILQPPFKPVSDDDDETSDNAEIGEIGPLNGASRAPLRALPPSSGVGSSTSSIKAKKKGFSFRNLLMGAGSSTKNITGPSLDPMLEGPESSDGIMSQRSSGRPISFGKQANGDGDETITQKRRNSVTPANASDGQDEDKHGLMYNLVHAFDGYNHDNGPTVRGVMKLVAVEDSVILLLDKSRKRKFLKKYPEMGDIIDILMHAKIDNFLQQLPFLKQTIEDDEENGDPEHAGLGMLAAVCKYEAFNEGELIFCEGDIGDKLYIILQGKVAVLNNTAHEKKIQQEAADNAKDGVDKDPGDASSQPEQPSAAVATVATGGAVNPFGKRRTSVKEVVPVLDSKSPGSSSRGRDLFRGASQMRAGSFHSKHTDGSVDRAVAKAVPAQLKQSIKSKIKQGPNGKLVVDFGESDVLATLVSGDYFGEMAVMVRMPRTSTVVASEKALMLTVSKNEWNAFLDFHEATRHAVELHMKNRIVKMFSAMNVSFFESVPKARFAKLAPRCNVLDVKKSTTIMTQGEKGNTFYVIIHGSVTVQVKAGIGGNDAPKADWFGRLYSGQYFGEIALVMDAPRKATVVTDEDTVLLSIDADTFKMFFEDNPRALAEVQIRMLGERADLISVLMIPQSITIFREFLNAEHSEENLVFWEKVRVFESTVATDDMSIPLYNPIDNTRNLPQLADAVIIWDHYLKEGVAQQVNISAKMRQAIEKVINVCQLWIAFAPEEEISKIVTRGGLNLALSAVRNRSVFYEAKYEIYKLMVRDSYPRFKKCEGFVTFINSIGLYNTANEKLSEKTLLKIKENSNAASNNENLLEEIARNVGSGLRNMVNRAASVRGRE